MVIYKVVERTYNSMITETISSGSGHELLFIYKTYAEARKCLEDIVCLLNRVFENTHKLIDEKNRKAYARYDVELDRINYVDIFIIEIDLT